MRVKLLKKTKDIKIEIERNPDDFNNYLELGKIYLELCDLVKAKKAFENLFLKDSSIDRYFEIANLYQEQNELNEAIKLYEKVLELDKKHYKSYEKIALCYNAKLHPRKAIKAYEEAQKLANDKIKCDTHMELTYSYRYLKLYEKADLILKKVIELEPQKTQAYIELGYLYEYYIEDKTKADEFYKKAIELPIENQKDILELADICFNSLKDYDKAIEFYENELKLQLKEIKNKKQIHYTDTTYNEIINIYSNYKKDYDKTLQKCYEALEYFPFSHFIYIEMIKVFKILEKKNAEKELIETILKLDSNKAFYINRELAKYYRKERRDFKTAILFLENIAKVKKCADLYNCMGTNYADLYEIDRAKECFLNAYSTSKECVNAVLNIFEMNLVKGEPFHKEIELVEVLKECEYSYLKYQLLKSFQKIKNGSCAKEFLKLWREKYIDSTIMSGWSFITIKKWIEKEESKEIKIKLLEAVEIFEPKNRKQ